MKRSLIERIRQWIDYFAPAQTFTARIFSAMMLLSFAVTVLYILLWQIVMPGQFEQLSYAPMLVVSASASLAFMRWGKESSAKLVFLGGSWVILTLIILDAGGTRAPIFASYTFVVMIAALFVNWQTAFLFGILSLISGLLMATLDPTGEKLQTVATPLSGLMTQMALMIVSATATYFVVLRSDKSLQQAQYELNERKKMETALRESEERFRLISSLTSDYTFFSRFDEAGEVEHIVLSGAFEVITGYNGKEFIERGGWRSTVHPEDRDKDNRDMQLLGKNVRVSTEIRILTKNGQTRWVQVYAHPVWDTAANRLVGVNGAVRDITEQKEAERAQHESETRMRALLDATTDVAFLMSVDGHFLTLNKTMAEAFFHTVDDLVGENVFDRLRPQTSLHRRPFFDEVIATRQPLRWQDQSGDKWWDNSIYPILSASGEVEAFAVYGKDITAQKLLSAQLEQHASQLEEVVGQRTLQLRQAKEQIEMILNNTGDAVALAKRNGDIEARNPAFTAMFGDDVSKCLERILWTVSGEDENAAVAAALLDVIDKQEQRRVEVRIAMPDQDDKDIDLIFIPVQLTDEDDRTGILVSAHDVTHIKEIERFKARFVDDVVHDLATPISGLSTRLYLLKKSPEHLEQHTQELENQVTHLRNLLSDLRTLSQLDRRQIGLNLNPTNLNNIAMRVFNTYEPVAITKHQDLSINTDAALPEIPLDEQQIERVVVNLVANAINYSPEHKPIRMLTAREAGHVLFSVVDEGMGIAPEDLPHIFDRFYRTSMARKAESGGTGLGLSIVKEIVNLHGGLVAVSSEPGHGSQFTIRLPIPD